ncbi:di-heme oxidoredictase family protein [Simiduia litorea]|uniref:di-heme oxidoredictase family protein n=1 Tax=Simiduia litorea TaxID=1435348 RepID=UPI0036F3FCA2
MKNNHGSKSIRSGTRRLPAALLAASTLALTQLSLADLSNPVIGNLLFEENFNTFNAAHWNQVEGDGCQIGLCGWGNQELQWYSANNLSIEDVPNEAGNKALVLQARNETVEGRAFTSGKVDSHNKLAVQYGMIEVRMRVPEVGIGLWPAAWMLGTSTASWPAKGEIDMMEMGHRAQGMADAGHAGADINSYVGANAIFYADAACVPENPTCAAMTAWQTDNAYVASQPLSNRFVTYRTYWTDSELRFTVVDNGIEYDMYNAPIGITEESSELQQPFYLLLNLAVGGNFTDAASNAQVTAPLPGKMYVDYVRVYQLDGMGQVFTGSVNQAETGTFGVFTDNTPTTNKLQAGASSDIYIWNQDSVVAGTTAPAEGDNVIAWRYVSPNQWFGGGIQTRQARDMSNFVDGVMKFKIKIPADVGFKIGIADTYTNENWLTFPAYETTYGLVRNGEWAEASIPVTDLRGSLIALQSLAGMFYIASLDGALPSNSFEFAIDDIVWEGGGGVVVSDSDNDGVNDDLDQCPNTPANTPVNSAGCALPAQGVDLHLEAEDYSLYYDLSAGNTGGAYRSDDVDIEITSDDGGGYNVGWIDANEWLEFSVDLAAGTYDLATRVASAPGGGAYSLSLDGNTLATDSVSATGGWQQFETHTLGQVTVAAGTQTLRVNVSAGGFNLNWIKFIAVNTDVDNDGVHNDDDLCPDTPAGVEVDAQGCTLINTDSVRVQAEDYSNFFDTTAGNTGTAYRTDDVDIEATTDADGGFNVGWTDAGEWLEYSVFLNEGTYDVSARVASDINGGNYSVRVDGVDLGANNVDSTGGWQSFVSQAAGQVYLTSGLHTVRVTFNAPGINLNWLHFTSVTVLDSDADGVPDANDQCPGSAANVPVDSFGCALPADSDGDGVIDSADQCPNTAAGVPVQANGCPVPVSVYGVEQTSADSVRFFVNTSSWADLHYRVAGGGQINVAMTQANGVNSYSVSGLAPSTVLTYSFTYWDTEKGYAVDSAEQSFTVNGGGNPVQDSDGDGVADSADACPGTPAGTAVDASGCPVVTPPTNNIEVAVANGLLVGGVGSSKPGFSLYVFDNDQGNAGSSCNGNCATSWPPLLMSDGNASGVAGLGSVTRTDGSVQVTHNGRPLYFYAADPSAGSTVGQGVGGVWWTVSYGTELGNIAPLFDASTALEPVIQYDRGDALVTRFSDRARDRHAKENHFQAYDHYLTFYWEDRTAAIEIVDYVAKGGTSIRMNVVTENKLDDLQAENRWWYIGMNTLAEYCGNGVMNMVDNTHYWKEETYNCREGRNIQVGDKLEFEISQFLDATTLPRGRSNYYGTTFLYIVGQGIVPWDVTDKVAFQGGNRLQRDTIPVPASARLGGDTSLHVQMTAEPDGHFQQMATNLGYDNGQPFVLGRRVHHTSFVDGSHDENPENGIFTGMPGLVGPHYINQRCAACHVRNGRAEVAAIGETLDKWVFKVGDAFGNSHPDLGRVLQPKVSAGAATEGAPSIASFSESNGLRKPNYQFSGVVPETFSARIAPQLNGIGLLEAIPEQAVLNLADENDANGDGISGRAQRVIDPVTGVTRLGRFGYKAAASSVKHQVAAAFNTDMGVMTSVMPAPDCGANQFDCGTQGVELGDQHLDNLVKYISLLGVRPQRDYNSASVIQGKAVFNTIGCQACHTETFQTSEFHPLAELRDQTIRPYTDLLLHDMGAGLADNLGEGEATGAEWRTAPLWGLGLSACVTGGVAGQHGWDTFGLDGHEYCTPVESYLHDGRARTLDEAIRWHGGEAEATKLSYESLSSADRNALMDFLKSL